MLPKIFYFILLFAVAANLQHAHENEKRIKFYERSSEGGGMFETASATFCTNIPSWYSPFLGFISTDKCIVVYEGNDCHWMVSKILPGKLVSMAKLNLTWRSYSQNSLGIQSFHECSEDDGTQLNVDIYNDVDLSGSVIATYKDICTCQNLPEIQPFTWSLDNHGTFMKYYSEENCKGHTRVIEAGRSLAADGIAITVQNNDTSIHLPVRSIGPDESTTEYFHHCSIHLEAQVFKFEILDSEFEGDQQNITNVELAASTTFINNGSTRITQVYSITRKISDTIRLDLASSFVKMDKVSVKASMKVEGGVSIPFLAKASIEAGLKGVYSYENGGPTSKGHAIIAESEQVFSFNSQIEVQPCSEFTVNGFVKMVRNKTIRYKIHSRISGVIGSQGLRATDIRQHLGNELQYIEDFDEYTVIAVANGEMKADYGLNTFVTGHGIEIPECVKLRAVSASNGFTSYHTMCSRSSQSSPGYILMVLTVSIKLLQLRLDTFF